jgi:hypothetical protein
LNLRFLLLTGLVSKVTFDSNYARDFYEHFVPDLRKWLLLTKADEPNLILLSKTWGRTMESMAGITRKPKHGSKGDSFLKAAQMFINLSGRFGMTPTDRARLAVPPETKPAKAQDPRADTLDGNWVRELKLN